MSVQIQMDVCPLDGTILGEHTYRDDRRQHECPACRRFYEREEVRQ